LACLNRWLAQYRPSQVACMDGSGELANNGDIQKLLTHHAYAIRPTAPASSFRNAPGERPHQDIGASLQVMICGENLENKFWPFAFNYALQISNVLPHGDRGVPLERFTAQRGSVKKIAHLAASSSSSLPIKEMGSWNPTFVVASLWASQAHCCRYNIGILSVNGSNELTPLNLTNDHYGSAIT
jgi:hypothetical protein